MSDVVNSLNTPEIRNEVKCPVCMEIPTREIFQCRNGHHICHKCDGKITQCPICRSSFRVSGRIRCLLSEKLIDTMTFDCPYKDDGCSEQVSRKELDEHGRQCKFRNLMFSICADIGYPKCQRGINPGDLQDSLKHLKEAHGAFVCDSFGETIQLEYFNRAVEIGKRQHWAPVIFTGGSEEPKTVFVFLAVYEPSDLSSGSMSLICAMIGEDSAPDLLQEGEEVDEEKKWRVNFSIRSFHNALNGEVDIDYVPNLDWSVPCAKIYQVKGLLQNMVLRTPASTLLNGYVTDDNGHLEVKISISNGNGNGGMTMKGMGTVAVSVQAVSIPNEDIVEPEPMMVGIPIEPMLQRYGESLMSDEGIMCDVCRESPIVNARYKCLQCADFDLCHECFRSGRLGAHNIRRHIFAFVQSAEQGDLLNAMSANRRCIFGSTARRRWGYRTSPFILRNQRCSVCNNEEVNYICIDCSENDTPCMFCNRCIEDERVHCEHIVLKVDRSQQLGYVMTNIQRGFTWSINESSTTATEQATD